MKNHIAESTAAIASNTELLSHIDDIIKIYSPMITIIGVLIGFIIVLLVWAWKRLEATQAKITTAFEDHVKENDKLHNKIFTEIRKLETKITELHEDIEKIKVHHYHQHGEEI